jgi:hypothetical protein
VEDVRSGVTVSAASFLPPVEEVRVIIDTVALMIVRNGGTFERMLREKEADNALFGFLDADHVHNAYFCATLAQLERQAAKIVAFDMSGLVPKRSSSDETSGGGEIVASSDGIDMK